MDVIASFAIFWGIWLLVPLLIDGFTTVVSLVSVLIARRRTPPPRLLFHEPFISVILPIYNSAQTLEACLRSIAAQDYPLGSMEVLLVNNGSTDGSFELFARLNQELPLQLTWHSITNKGKSGAMNAGIHLSRGLYIFNIDSDTVLAPDAVRQVVETMEAEPDLGAVTGAIQVLPMEGPGTRLQRLLAECEFFEYLTAFSIGREYQTIFRNLYTLSGAFSVFRRSVLLQTWLYSQATVSEDTDLTFTLYERFRDQRIGCVSTAIAYVHPIESVGALYAQRVRWQRGQVEVSARYRNLMRRSIWRLSGFAPARVLMIDHTLAFPRLVWTLLLPILSVFDYPPTLIAAAALVLYSFYVVLDLLWIAVAWVLAEPNARSRLRGIWWLLPLLPLYRMLIFWFRLSGFLHAVAEPGVWRVQDPITQTREGWADLCLRAQRLAAHGLMLWSQRGGDRS